MAWSSKIRRLDDDDIVQYGIDVPVAGVARGRGETREIRDMAVVFGAVLNIPRPVKAAPAEHPTEPAPAPAPQAPAAELPAPSTETVAPAKRDAPSVA